MQKRLLLLLQLMFIGLVGISVTEVDSFTESISVNSFEFTHTNGTILSLSSYSDKPILLEWGASWCSTCHINLATMNELYPEFGNDINFISLSYGGSSDTLERVISGYKGSYAWDFGLDHTNAAANSDIQARNGYTMVLSKNLEILRRWDFVALITNGQKNELKSVLNLALGNVVDTSEFASGSQTGVGTLEVLFGGGLLTAVLIIGGVVYKKRNQTINESSEHLIQQKSRKQNRQLTDLKQVLNKQQAEQQDRRASTSETYKPDSLKQKSRLVGPKKGASKRIRRR